MIAIRARPRGAAVLAGLLSVSSPAFADTFAEATSYARTSVDGRFLLVIFAPVPPEQDGRDYSPAFCAKAAELRHIYPRGGLYRNDGSRDPIFAIDWYSPDARPASDGEHVYRVNEWTTRFNSWPMTYEQEGLAIFERSRLLRSYSLSDLVALPSLLPQSVSHVQWLESALLSDANREIVVVTKHGESVTIDLNSGDIRSKTFPQPLAFLRTSLFSPVGLIVWLAFSFIALASIAVLIRLGQRRRGR